MIIFNVISILPQAFLCSLSVRHLYSVITQRTGTEENLQLCLQTLLQPEREREQMLSWRLALLTMLILVREQVLSPCCHDAFGDLGPAVLPPSQLVLQPISQGCPAWAIRAETPETAQGGRGNYVLILSFILDHKVISAKQVFLAGEETLHLIPNLNRA